MLRGVLAKSSVFDFLFLMHSGVISRSLSKEVDREGSGGAGIRRETNIF